MKNTSISSPGIYMDTTPLKRLADQFRLLGPEARKAMRVGIRGIVNMVRDQGRINSSYSQRIPGSIRGRTSAHGLSGSVVAGGSRAPNAAPIENKGKGFVRHPVFGNKDVWTDLNSHPAFLAPAFDASKDEALEILDTAVFMAIERATGMTVL